MEVIMYRASHSGSREGHIAKTSHLRTDSGVDFGCYFQMRLNTQPLTHTDIIGEQGGEKDITQGFKLVSYDQIILAVEYYQFYIL